MRVLLFEGNCEDFEGQISEIDGPIADFQFLDRLFFHIAEPGTFDRHCGVHAGVSAGVMGFVESDDAVARFFGLFDTFDDEVT